MTTPTAARPTSSDGSHWYFQDGRPCHTVKRASGDGERPTTLADARKLGLLPSVTNILGVLDKPALTNWKIEQAVLATHTAPKLPSESLDDFIHRVIHTERQQDQEAQVARDRGTQIHNAMEKLFKRESVDPELLPWVMPAFIEIRKRQYLFVGCELVLVGRGYAGRTDLIHIDESESLWLWDWKSAKTLPTKGAWTEHTLQLAAYAAAHCVLDMPYKRTRTGNVYISTVERGKFVVCEHEPWEPAYEAFQKLLRFWQWQNNYKPNL